MITLKYADIWGFEHAVRGMRNPMNSWDKSDTFVDYDLVLLGKKDKELMKRLVHAGPSHRKFLRQIFVSVDITAPLYWWKEFDTYKVGTVSNSCSTMHKIHDKEFTLDDFSVEHLQDDVLNKPFKDIISCLNFFRQLYVQDRDKDDWWQMIQLLPSSYNQKRTVTMNYENLLNIYETRRNHKLDEWKDFCKWIEKLPNAELITGEEN
ncbi:hypothetical protein [uncultured Catenibacterium sp.]|uniref:hypothetical protein n=1 Tax=uncultured Catenibacterium sp. TaxID=286142 RepID=UPI0025E4DDAF|nr:hypothetical protein [uncultured Catenibacterium sp.]